MKKFLMIAVAAMAVASQAASVKWQLSSTTDTGYAAGQTALLFVGTADETFTHGDDSGLSLADYVNALLTEGADAATAAAFDTATTKNARGKITTDAKTKAVSYAANTDLVGMIVVLDTANDKYSAFSFATKVAGNGDTQLLTSNAASSTGFQPMPTSGGDTPAIPEPATGALALAGVALLFKRRRA